jgi:D-alanyl-lipoteichoic acid acyltransferase DltB (MBOAT superfamily)
MDLNAILVFTAIALLAGIIAPGRWRIGFVLVCSLAAIFWLQAALPLRNLDFWLPATSVGLVVLTWAATRPSQPGVGAGNLSWRLELPAALILSGTLFAIGLTRYAGPVCCLTATRPPPIWQILLVVGLWTGLVWLVYRVKSRQGWIATSLVVVILAFLVVLKTPDMSMATSLVWRRLSGQSIQLAAASDFAWLGYSYLAFRLIHALRDFQAGKLPAYSLADFVTYAVFFPSWVAGPIDRSQRWIAESNARKPVLQSDRIEGIWRILRGVFKKFVLADGLALIALNSQNAAQIQSTGWAWLILYAYALRIFFDFSGYTDIAIGLARLAGFHLPENFDRPYLKTNLTLFWNSWHMTLAQWFRAYFFNPLARSLRGRGKGKITLPAWAIILICQVTTMLLIGLWHGITLNFAFWGLWHGVGLFIHNRWSEWMRPRSANMENRPGLQGTLKITGWLLTFNFVVLGWIWFALPSPEMAWNYFKLLFGLGS